MEPKCENCYYFLEITDTDNAEHDYYCLLVEATEEGWIGKCGNKNSRYYGCLRDVDNTCELQEDKDA